MMEMTMATKNKAKQPTKTSTKTKEATTATLEVPPPPATSEPARKRHVGPGGKRIAAPKPPTKPKRVSALDAAAQILAKSEVPLRAKELIAQMEASGLWKSPGGRTPEATLYAAITREIATKGTKARFKKHDKGVFVATKA
jgi:hypothetical protein